MTLALVAEVPLESRRERKKRATRLALKLAALDLVATRGFASVTVEDIADAVDVSVRTFFNYFASKEAAVVGDDPELTEAMGAELVRLPPELSPLDALRSVMFQRLQAISDDIDLSGEDHAVWSRRFGVVQSQPEVLLAYTKHLTVVEKTLTDAMVRRLGGDEHLRLYSSLVTTCTLGAMRVAVMSWRGEGGTVSLVELAEAAFDVLAGGLTLVPSKWSPAASGAREDAK
jgi:AcrR family transcriptional regulator